MYKIKNIKTNAYLVKELGDNLYHFEESSANAMVFENAKAIPKQFKNKDKWERVKIAMKKIYKEQEKSLYQISKNAKVSISSLYELSEGMRNIDNFSVASVKRMAKYLNLTMDELVEKVKDYRK